MVKRLGPGTDQSDQCFDFSKYHKPTFEKHIHDYAPFPTEKELAHYFSPEDLDEFYSSTNLHGHQNQQPQPWFRAEESAQQEQQQVGLMNAPDSGVSTGIRETVRAMMIGYYSREYRRRLVHLRDEMFQGFIREHGLPTSSSPPLARQYVIEMENSAKEWTRDIMWRDSKMQKEQRGHGSGYVYADNSVIRAWRLRVRQHGFDNPDT